MPEERYEFTFRVEMTTHQENRVVVADGYTAETHWLRFVRKGQLYWMANRDHVISMECQRNV